MADSDVRDAARLAKFECSGFEITGAQIALHYRVTGTDGREHAFTETITLPASLAAADQAVVEPIVRLLHFAAAPSYFKAFAPARITVPSGLTHQERHFFTEVLTNGLGATGTVYMAGILDGQAETLLSQEKLDSLNRYEFNLDTAASLMEQAGYTRNADGKWADASGATISVEYTFPADFADFSAAARDATTQLNDFGFDISERALPWQESRDAVRAGDEAVGGMGGGGRPDMAQGGGLDGARAADAIAAVKAKLAG